MASSQSALGANVQAGLDFVTGIQPHEAEVGDAVIAQRASG